MCSPQYDFIISDSILFLGFEMVRKVNIKLSTAKFLSNLRLKIKIEDE